MNSKQNRRVDHILSVLLRISKDKAFERLCKLEGKGKSSHRLCEINKRHKSAMDLISKGVSPQELSKTSWKVSSSSGQNFYTVQQNKERCSCCVKCAHCSACIHMFTCTCADSHLQTTVCKHVHIVQIMILNESDTRHEDSVGHEDALNEVDQPQSSKSHCSTVDPEDEQLVADLNYLANQADEEQPIDEESSREYFIRILSMETDVPTVSQECANLKNKICELNLLLDNATSIDAVRTAKRHVTSAINSLKALDHQPDAVVLLPAKRLASNAKQEKQRRFYSTKKKRVTENRWAKPTESEKELCSKQLEEQEIVLCSICYKEDDNRTSEAVIWIQCFVCESWFHEVCVRHNMDVTINEFVCENCEMV